MRERTDTALAGQTLAGRYDVLELLGAGGMGAVYRAHDRELDELVALKVIHTDVASQPTMLQRFRHEVKLARRVTHKNVARTFELGTADGIMFCTMELVDGESLRAKLRRVKVLPIAEAVAVARELCAGLAAAHAADVIHRDIKPDNVLIAAGGRVVLADFGVAALRVATHAGELSGTPEYMAPEQARGESPTPASDVYAVGVLLYEMVAGRRAFSGSLSEVLIAKQERDHLALDLASVPMQLAHVIGRATAREPSERIASAGELGRLLAPWSTDAATPISVQRVSPDEHVLHTVVVLAPRSETDDSRLHIATGVHEELLRHLGLRPRIRVLARVDGGAIAGATVVELRAGRTLSIVIHHRSLSAPTMLEFPLRMQDVELTAEAAATAIATAVAEERPIQASAALDALELMWRARLNARKGFGSVRAAFELLEQAYARCPEDPRIAASLAVACVRFSVMGPEHQANPARAVELVTAALATAPNLAESHVAAGHLVLHTGDPAVAAAHFRTAIACSPYVAEAHEGLGRMLLEAGFLDVALARLDDALAMAPELITMRWDIARAHALDGRWQLHDETVGSLWRDGDRPLMRARFAWWRGDFEAIHTIRAHLEADSVPDPFLMDRMTVVALDGGWANCRDELVAYATDVRWQSRRRRAFLAQLVAEAAGFANDVETCTAMIDHATEAGLFDLHWFERCPLLAPARHTREAARARERIKRRADAILDALYGDIERDSLYDTIIS
jgi:serine/threonine-protein kinase